MLTISDRLQEVQSRLARACDRAHRAHDSVQLLAVTKTRSVDELKEIYALGVRKFGENRVPEALTKQSQLPSDLEWHMIGHLQSNKAKDSLGFGWVHSIDKLETAQALEKVFARAGKTLSVLLEANTSGEASKEGVRDWDTLAALAEGVSQCPHLVLRGLMTMAPFSPDEGVVRPCFSRLRDWRDRLARSLPQSDLSTLSMGMTNDFEWAVAEGSTLVRIGTALFEGFR